MSIVSLSTALTREHREIDTGIERFVADLDRDVLDREPLLSAFDALRRHIYLEEALLFPPIRQAGLVMPVMVMLREHGSLWRLMDSMTEMLVQGDPGAFDDRLRSGCQELLAQLEQHNRKEEPIIYPSADSDLSEEASAELAEFLRSGSLPDGWVCATNR